MDYTTYKFFNLNKEELDFLYKIFDCAIIDDNFNTSCKFCPKFGTICKSEFCGKIRNYLHMVKDNLVATQK